MGLDLDRIERAAVEMATFADGYEEATALIVATLRGEGLAFDIPRGARRMRSLSRDTLDLVNEVRMYRAAMEKLANPTSAPRSEEAALIQIEVAQIATRILDRP